MSSYLKIATEKIAFFKHFEITQVSRSQNSHVDSLARLPSTLFDNLTRTISIVYTRPKHVQYQHQPSSTRVELDGRNNDVSIA